MNKTAQHKKAIIEALEQSLGIVTSACKKVGVGRTTFYGWLNDDEEFAKQVKDIENIALDFAESQLHQQIKLGNPTSTIFYLKTKGKNRGYVERQEISGDLDNQLIVRVIDGNKNN
jgi:predicted DNA-binding transcriptional regulator AlpA